MRQFPLMYVASPKPWAREILDREPGYAAVGAIAPDGTIFCGAPAVAGRRADDRIYFRRAMATDDFVVGEYAARHVVERPSLYVSHPVIDERGVKRGVVFAALQIEHLEQLLAGVPLREGEVLGVIDGRGTVVASSRGDRDRWVGTAPDAPIIRRMLAERDGVGGTYGRAPASRDRVTTSRTSAPRSTRWRRRWRGSRARTASSWSRFEDDELVRATAARALRAAGFAVVEAGHPRDALRVVCERCGIDLLLTDVIMPDLSGPDLAKLVAAERPSIRVLFMSGYTGRAHESVEGGALVQKPFTPEMLVARARAVLDAGGPAESAA
jgi:CheY-like chemotaxis protein